MQKKLKIICRKESGVNTESNELNKNFIFYFPFDSFFRLKTRIKAIKGVKSRQHCQFDLAVWIVKTWSCNYLQVVIPHLLCDVPNSNSEKFSSLQWLIDFTYLHRNLFLLFFVIAHLHHFTFHMCSFFCFNLLFSFNLLFFFSFHIHFLVSLHFYCIVYCSLINYFTRSFVLLFQSFFIL